MHGDASLLNDADDEGMALTPGPSPNSGRGEWLRLDAVHSAGLDKWEHRWYINHAHSRGGGIGRRATFRAWWILDP